MQRKFSLKALSASHFLCAVFYCAFIAILSGCGGGGPPAPKNTDSTSTAIPALHQRIAFLNQYVSFRRNYDALDYSIAFHDNSGGAVAGPSDYDIRFVAIVP